MIAVLDASVVVKWLFPDPAREPHAEHALSVLEAIRTGRIEPLQPPHWLAEVMAVTARLNATIADSAVDLLDAMEFRVMHEPGIYKRAVDLAARLNQHLFDTLYHAVAIETGATLITADRKYYNKAQRVGQIMFLAEWDRTGVQT
jgi:predicted nucleic acid-binding protein